MPRRYRSILAVALVLAMPANTFGWNYTGHRVIASIAYRRLDEPTRRKVADLLRAHPAQAQLWAGRPTNGEDELLNLFWNASVFADDARSEPWRRYGRPAAHYVNYRIRGGVAEPPLDGENILNSYVAHLKEIRDPRTPAADRALHLSWVFHQAGDVHQPLHAVARFSAALPGGDRGGNEVAFPNPRARGDRGNNLHAYWDDLLGIDDDPAAVDRLAAELMAEHPADRYAVELGRTNIGQWAEESVEVALKTVYNDLDPEIARFVDPPVGYEADAVRAARRRAALAGYRLADELKRLVADPAPAEPVGAEARPRWFKGNLHTHSLWSDGNDYPEMIADWYVRNGYHFLALSDHNVLSQGPRWLGVAKADERAKHDGFARYRERFGDDWVETRTVEGDLQVRLKPLGEFRHLFERPGEFLMIQGEEITDKFESKPIHLNASNLLEVIEPRGGKSVVEVMTNDLAAVEEQAERLGRPILGHLNHPNFGYAITAEELAMVTKERFFEVYNGHPGVHHLGDATHAGVERMWDVVNTIRVGELGAAPVRGLATDDSHNYFGRDGSSPGRGWVVVRARFLTPESILRGLEAGDFYASSGVTLKDVRYSPAAKALELEIEPQGEARFTTRFVGTLKGYDPARRPVNDPEGRPLPVTQRYSDDVGRVLATVEGTTARYALTGEELYVRAVVTSTLPPDNPSFPDQKAQAWTQPVGWEGRVDRPE